MLFYDINRAGRRIECELFLRDPAYQDAGIYRISGFQNFLRETYAEQSRDVDTGILIPAERIEAIKKKEHKATVQDTVCAYTLSNIQSTIASNTEEQYRKASSILIQQWGEIHFFFKRIYLCGGISEYDPAADASPRIQLRKPRAEHV